MTGAVLLALAASAAWGVSDFLGGLRARTASLPVVLLLSQLAGLVVLLGMLAVPGHAGAPLGASALVCAALAGACGVIALGTLYLATARGGLALVAPISAVAAALPVLVGLAQGESLTVRSGVGVVLALLGALAVGLPAGPTEPGRRAPRRPGPDRGAIAAAATSAVCAAGFFVLIRAAGQGADPVAVTVAARLCGVALVSAWALGQLGQIGRLRRVRGAARPGPAAVVALATIGVTDALAELCFTAASAQAPLSVVAPLASLYPAVTVGLAVVVVRERLGRLGSAGLAGALAGAVLLG